MWNTYPVDLQQNLSLEDNKMQIKSVEVKNYAHIYMREGKRQYLTIKISICAC